MKTYEVEVKQVDDLFIELPPELIKEAGWKEGDDLKFETKEGGSILVNKVEYTGVDIDLDDEEVLKLSLAAHERGITLNDFIIEILEGYLSDEKA